MTSVIARLRFRVLLAGVQDVDDLDSMCGHSVDDDLVGVGHALTCAR